MKAQTEKAMTPDEAKAIAQDAWLFGMPLVYIEIQIDALTHVSKLEGTRAPINQFVHYRKFPDASNKTVVGFNVDTLYSLAQLDVSKEPMVLSVPEMGDRFWVMQIIDGWNNVPHAPGSRSVGGKGGNFAIVGPDWKGTLPAGVTELRVPTNFVMIGGRTYTGGPDDYDAVHAIQDQYKLVPLSAFGKDYTPPTDVPLKPGVDEKTPVPNQVLAMSPEKFFNSLNRLLVTNPPEPADPGDDGAASPSSVLGRARSSAWMPLHPKCARRSRKALLTGIKTMKETVRGKIVNGWQIALDMGRYGKKYAYRAGWTFYGVGGNLPEDAVYPFGEKRRRRQTLQWGEQVHAYIQKRRDPAGQRFLVTHDVRQRRVSRRQPDQPLRARRPQRHEIRRRWIADDLHPERITRQRQRKQLAAGPEG